MDEIFSFTTWLELEVIMLIDRSKPQRKVSHNFINMSYLKMLISQNLVSINVVTKGLIREKKKRKERLIKSLRVLCYIYIGIRSSDVPVCRKIRWHPQNVCIIYVTVPCFLKSKEGHRTDYLIFINISFELHVWVQHQYILFK